METKNLEYWKNNCEEDYLHTPISVLRYISELEQALALLSVVKSVKEKDKPTFEEWASKWGYYQVGTEWFNEHGCSRMSVTLKEMYREEYQL